MTPPEPLCLLHLSRLLRIDPRPSLLLLIVCVVSPSPNCSHSRVDVRTSLFFFQIFKKKWVISVSPQPVAKKYRNGHRTACVLPQLARGVGGAVRGNGH